MSLMTIASETLTSIANAIRAKTGKTAQMTPAEMVSEIGSLSTDGGEVWKLHTITDIVITSSTLPHTFLKTYIRKCAQWCYYPTSEAPHINSVARGFSFDINGNDYVPTNWLGSTDSTAGNTAGTGNISMPTQYQINDQSVSSTRLRGNISSIPAGTYTLKFFGVSR